jgi:hypothetical protein
MKRFSRLVRLDFFVISKLEKAMAYELLNLLESDLINGRDFILDLNNEHLFLTHRKLNRRRLTNVRLLYKSIYG